MTTANEKEADDGQFQKLIEAEFERCSLQLRQWQARLAHAESQVEYWGRQVSAASTMALRLSFGGAGLKPGKDADHA